MLPFTLWRIERTGIESLEEKEMSITLSDIVSFLIWLLTQNKPFSQWFGNNYKTIMSRDLEKDITLLALEIIMYIQVSFYSLRLDSSTPSLLKFLGAVVEWFESLTSVFFVFEWLTAEVKIDFVHFVHDVLWTTIDIRFIFVLLGIIFAKKHCTLLYVV